MKLVPINKNDSIFMLTRKCGLLIPILQMKTIKFLKEPTPCLTLVSGKPALELMSVCHQSAGSVLTPFPLDLTWRAWGQRSPQRGWFNYLSDQGMVVCFNIQTYMHWEFWHHPCLPNQGHLELDRRCFKQTSNVWLISRTEFPQPLRKVTYSLTWQ